MENNFDSPLSEPTSNNIVDNSASMEPADILELGYDPDYLMSVDDEYLDMVTTIAPYMGSPVTNKATSQTQTAIDPNDWFAANKVFDKPTQRDVKPREAFSIRNTNFDHFYAHPQYHRLGFSPTRNNEEFYNENSDWVDNFSRSMGQFGKNFTPGFSFFGLSDALFDNNNQGVFDLFDSDPDTEAAVDMSEAMRIGNDSSEGFGGAFNRFALNSAYSISIMSSIAAEELAMWGATAALTAATPATFGATGVAAAATGTAAAARTVYNAGRFAKMLRTMRQMGNATSVGRMFNGGYQMVKTLKSAEKARDFWNTVGTGKNVVGRIFLPETMQALRSFDRTKDVANGLGKFGKTVAGFGGFYRDVRMIDLALDESRLEAGFVYNDLVSNGMAIEQFKNGNTDLSEKQLKDIQAQAAAGSFTTLKGNAGLIYLTNRVTFGAMVTPFSRGLRRVLDNNLGAAGKKIMQTKKFVKNGKVQQNVVGRKKSLWTREGWRQRSEVYNFGDYIRFGTHGALRFFAGNISEGVQELYQEAMQVGVVDYYSGLIKDPAANKRYLYNASLDSAIQSQMSAQGFEVFMSGFATGGILGGGNKLIYNVAPDTFNRVFNKEEFAKKREEREKQIDNLVKTINEGLNLQAKKGQSIFDVENLNFIKAKQGAEGMQNANYEGDRLDFKDNQDYIEFNTLVQAINNGMVDTFRDQIKAIVNLDDKALTEAYPHLKKEIKSGKTRKQFNALVEKSYDLEKTYKKERDDNPNPYDVNKYKYGEREYFIEMFKQQAWEHATYLKMFTKQSFMDSQKRMQSIFDALTIEDIIYAVGKDGSSKVSKLAASDLTVLLDPQSVRSEIKLLANEIANLEQGEDVELLNKKKKKKELLENYFQVFTDANNQTTTKGSGLKYQMGTQVSKKEGILTQKFDKRKTSKLTKSFTEYIEFLAEDNNIFADKSKVNEVVKQIVDYGELQYRTKMYDKAVEVLNNPTVFDELTERTYKFIKDQYLKDKDVNTQRIKLKDAMNQDDVSQVINDLHDLGITPDPTEVEDFIATGDIENLQSFYTEYGPLDPMQDPAKFINVARIKNNYTELTNPTAEDVETEEIKDAVEEDAEVKEKAATVINSDNKVNSFAKNILLSRLAVVNGQLVKSGKKRLTLEQWQKTEEAQELASILHDLKALWVQSLDPTQDNLGVTIKSGEGFKEWILENKDDPTVRELVVGMGEPLGLTFELIEGKAATTKNKERKDIVDAKGGLRIRKVVTDVKGQKTTGYVVELADGSPVPESFYEAAGIDPKNIRSSYSTIQEAKNKIFRKLLDTIPDTDTFTFGIGENVKTLRYGDVVTDKDGRRFIVLGTPAKVKEDGTLFILPEDQIDKYRTTKSREKAAKRVSAADFAEYNILEETFSDTLVAKDTPRLTIKNILGIYALGITDKLSTEDAKKALKVILQQLTPEELQEIQLTVTKNDPGDFKKVFKDEISKKENKRIRIVKEDYSFNLNFTNPETRNKINKALEETGFQDVTLNDMAIQLPSGNYRFLDESGNVIENIFSRSNSELKQFFHNPKSALYSLAKQQVLRKRILDKVKLGDSVLLSDVVDGTKFFMKYLYDTENFNVNVSELTNSTYDGEQVVIDYTYRRDAQTKKRNRVVTIRTNYPVGSDEHKALRNKVQKELSEKTLANGTTLMDYLKKTRKTDRYHSVIKLPNGTIAFAPLKARALTEESQSEILEEIVKQVEKTKDENLEDVDGTVRTKSVSFNDTFNEGETMNSFYIYLKSGYNAELKVNQRGNIEFKIIDTVADKTIHNSFIQLKGDTTFNGIVKLLQEGIKKDKKISKKGLSISKASFRQNIPDTVTPQAILLLTNTNFQEESFNTSYVEYEVSHEDVVNYQEGQRAADTIKAEEDALEESKKKDSKLDQAIDEATPNAAGVNGMSQEEFDELENNDFEELSLDDLKLIAIKVAKNIRLSEREVSVKKVKDTTISTLVATLEKRTKSSDDNEYEKALEARNIAKEALEAYTKELQSKKDSGEITAFDYIQFTANGKDAEFKKLKKAFIKAERIVNSFAGKILTEGFTNKETESIEMFMDWAKNNLPDFITIKDISEIADRLKVNGVPIGLFVTNLTNLAGGVATGGTIYVGEQGFRYHEAFHSVFRLLLTTEEQNKYLAIAKKEARAKLRSEGKDFTVELSKFRSKAAKYQKMSAAALEREYYEEYMADEFEKFKKNPRSTKTSSTIKSFFNRLLEWIKGVTRRFTKNELNDLFENIDAGKYKGAGIINNNFTTGLSSGIALEAYKMLAYEKVPMEFGSAEKFVDPDTATKVIRTMGAAYLNKLATTDPKVLEDIKGKSRQEILIDTIKDFRDLYNPVGEHNGDKSGAQIDKLFKLYTALGGTIEGSTNESLTQQLEYQQNAVEATMQYISVFDTQILDEQYQNEELEYEEGLRNTSQWDKDQSMIGGFNSLPTAFRSFLGTTQIIEADEFGNTKLLNGQQIYTPVDYMSAYNGLLKSVKNTTDASSILRNMVAFSIGNVQTAAVVDKIFNKLGGAAFTKEFVMESTNEEVIDAVTNKIFFNEINVALENYRVDYLFYHTNLGAKGKKIAIYNAANRDDAVNQIDVWKQAHNEKYKKIRDNQFALNEAVDALQALSFNLDTDNITKIKDAVTLAELSQKLSNDIYDTVGIKFSPAYIQFSIASNLRTTDSQLEALLLNNKNAEPIEIAELEEMVVQLKLTQEARRTSAYLFNRKGGIKSRLQKLAKNNALFDETIGQSVFLNPEGNFVYAHQKQTLHLKMLSKMNDDSFLSELETANEGYNLENILLESEAFRALSEQDRLQVLRVAGTKTSFMSGTTDNALSDEGGLGADLDGKTYGGLKGPEFVATLINTYLSQYQTYKQENKTVEFVNQEGEVVETALAPVLIRVIEASNTGDLVALPVIKTVEIKEGKEVLTSETTSLFLGEIRREFKRIQREAAKKDEDKAILEGYNSKNGVVQDDYSGRAYKFNDTATLLESQREIENRVEANDPKFNDNTAQRIIDGTQDHVYVDQQQAEKIGLTVEGSSARVTVKSKKGEREFQLISLGQISEVNATNIASIVANLGSSVLNQQEFEKLTDKEKKVYTQKVKIGDVTLRVDTAKNAEFLKGGTESRRNKSKFGYRLVAVENFTEIESGGLEFNYKEDLEKFAIANTDATLEEAIESLSENMSLDMFNKILNQRLIQEFNKFDKTLENYSVRNMISDDIKKGIRNDEGIAQGDGAMEQLNLIRDNERHNLMQIFFNDWLNTKAINQLILGDQAISLKDAVDKVKRAKMQNASHISASSPVFDERLGVNHTNDNISLISFTDPEFDRTYAKGKGERADAQMYITTKALRHMLFGFAQLDARKADLINRIEKGERVNAEELFGKGGYIKEGAVFNSLKLVYGDGQTFLKMSAVVLTPELTTKVDGTPKPQYEKLHNLRLRLEKVEEQGNNTLGIAAPLSASKMMKKNTLSYEEAFSEFNPNDNAVVTTDLKAEFMGLQLVNPSNKIIITDPTQMKSLITSELLDSAEVYVKAFGVESKIPIGKLREEYHKATTNRLNLKYFGKVNLITNFTFEAGMNELNLSKQRGKLTVNLENFLKFASESLKASQASSNVLEYFNPEKDYNLNNPMVQKSFQQLFLSYFAKQTMSEKSPGLSLALASDFGVNVVRRVFSVDENGNPDKHEIIREKYYNFLDNPPAIQIRADEDGKLIGLEAALENSGGKGVVVLDQLRHNLKEYDNKGNFTGQRYSEGLAPAHFAEIAEDFDGTNIKMPDVVQKAFAVRIPSQDKHSAYATKFVDFLPAFYGSTAIFSKELIEISGADFDIDKVYTHIKEWYKDGDNNYVEYGDLSRSKTDQFRDYIHYVKEAGVQGNSIYADAFEKAKTDFQKFMRYSEEELSEFKELTGLSEDYLRALKVLNLPTTQKKFDAHVKKKGMPYEAALNNQILDYKFAMWSNEGNTVATKDGVNPIAYDPAVLDPLLEVRDYIQTELPELAELFREDGLDVDNLLGKFKGFSNNKEGAASIGAAVLPNLYLNVLGEAGVKMRTLSVKGQVIRQVSFNGIDYTNFGEQYERRVIKKKVKGKEVEVVVKGERTQYIISALITAMTDNAKERLAAKLGLNRDALSVVTTLTKLGVPIKTSILLVNNAYIRDEYFQTTIGAGKGIRKRITDIMETLTREHPGIETDVTRVTDDLLYQQASNPSLSDTPAIDLEYNQAVGLYSILKQFVTAHDLKSFVGKMSGLMNFSKGFGRTFVDFDERLGDLRDMGIDMNDSEFDAAIYNNAPLPIDIRKIIKNKPWQFNLYNVANHFEKEILPNIFLSKTETFKEIFDTVTSNLSSNVQVLTGQDLQKVSDDLLSYLTIRAYMHKLEKRGQSVALSSLSNAMLYPQSGTALNIHSLVDELRQEFPNNEFLNEFSFNENARELDNKKGIHLLESNTFGKRSDLDRLRVQTDFMELFSERRTEAAHIIHYMMVKDGLQFGAGTLLDAITPQVLDSFTVTTKEVFNMFKNKQKDLFKTTFGVDFNKLINEFTIGYLQSTATARILDEKKNVKLYSQLFEDTEALATSVTTRIAANNPQKLYIFSDNQQEIGANGLRGMDNTVGLTLKYDLTTFYDIDDLNNFVERFDEQIEQIKNADKKIVFPKVLMTKQEVKNLKTSSKEIYNYIDETLRQEFGYSLDTGIINDKSDPNSASKAAIRTLPVAMDFSGGSRKLIVDIFKGVARLSPSDNVHNLRRLPDTLSRKNLNSKKKGAKRFTSKDKIQNNESVLKKAGFVVKNKPTKTGLTTKMVELPVILKVTNGDTKRISKTKKVTRYFKLVQAYGPVRQEQMLINPEQSIVEGNAGIYEEIDMQGSIYQNPIGFMFDSTFFTRPSYNTVKEFVSSLDEEGGFIDNDMIGFSEEVQDVLAEARVKGFEVIYRGNQLFIDLNTFSENNSEELVPIKEVTMQQLEDRDIDMSFGTTTESSDEYSSDGTNSTEETEEVDTSDAPVISMGAFADSLFGASEAEESDVSEEYKEITDFWNENIDLNAEALARLKEQKIVTLEDFIAKRNDPDMNYNSDEEFLDNIKSCII